MTSSKFTTFWVSVHYQESEKTCTEWEKIFANFVFDKCPISYILI